jgi:1-acyl-sn-glycerol-3-phosphate acyltransferase
VPSLRRLSSLARALLFNVFLYAWTALLCVATLPAAPFMGERAMRGVARFWMRGLQAALRVVVGLSYEVRGRERLPPGPALIASKHQSAWETIAFHLVVPDVVIGLKDELTRIPVFGWYLMIGGGIRIDRGGAARALRSLVDGAKAAAARGCSVLIFPEGTRKAPGDPPDYKSGVAALYAGLGLPVAPVALNSGLYWRRREFAKRPGRIVVEFLEPIPPGMERKAFMAELEARIEAATARLVREGAERLGDGLDSGGGHPYIQPAAPR